MKMIKNGLFACVCSLVVFLLPAGISANEVSLTNEDNGKTVSLHTGDTLVINLRGNITTGYSWNVVEPQPSMLTVLGKLYRQYVPDPHRPGVCGSPGTFIFRFQAASVGSSELAFAYARCWEKNIPPTQTFKISLVIE